ncbi:hypothetical protein V7O66_01270 [Methanolobus sp. ZRKC3]|uniref:hypothetical protein n=1 Tax=Methanolobus sp. ZRKC3 TaxID=3125786 RepID=UPI003247472F
MRPALLFICILVIAIFSLPMTGHAQSGAEHYIHFNKMTVDFEGQDAMVTMSYDLNMFSRVYVLFLGSHNLKPTLETVLFDFDDIEVVRIGRNEASVFVQNISRENEEYFLHDSHPLGAKVDVLTMIYPDGSSRTVPDATSTPNTFYSDV